MTPNANGAQHHQNYKSAYKQESDHEQSTGKESDALQPKT
jgi:hypothetical protein